MSTPETRAPLAVHLGFDQLSPGNRVQTWDGITGTVTAVEFIRTPRFDGELITLEARVAIHSKHLPTFDSYGWPKSFEGDITRTVRRFGTDLRWHTAPPATAKEN